MLSDVWHLTLFCQHGKMKRQGESKMRTAAEIMTDIIRSNERQLEIYRRLTDSQDALIKKQDELILDLQSEVSYLRGVLSNLN